MVRGDGTQAGISHQLHVFTGRRVLPLLGLCGVGPGCLSGSRPGTRIRMNGMEHPGQPCRPCRRCL